MSEKKLHIISFDIPYPANYGGVIDVFYKIKTLKKAGIGVFLHCYAYGRNESPELEALCEKVYYYPRRTGWRTNISLKPYIVNSRRSEQLIKNLLADDYPILFEGLHSCFYLNDPRLEQRTKTYRESNIEHHYYLHLAKAEKNIFKKLFFTIESWRLKRFQEKLKYADLMLAVSASDTAYLQKHFPQHHVEYLPSFHPNDDFEVQAGKSDFFLYHGKLSVTENYNAAEYLVEEVFAGLPEQLVIAGMDPPTHLIQTCSNHKNVRLITNPDDATMFGLIRDAQANILVTFQPTGLKLKLLNTLFKGRFCIVNPEMVQGTGLDSLCEIACSTDELKEKIALVAHKDFDMQEVAKRREVLIKNYSNTTNAQKLITWVFK
ncbi:MAG TPA: glycosyltransferase family 1 protein [Bacteroidales bacterium]|nr:glycosyltransferase family 1 protein [Bacteroidales bacterium]